MTLRKTDDLSNGHSSGLGSADESKNPHSTEERRGSRDRASGTQTGSVHRSRVLTQPFLLDSGPPSDVLSGRGLPDSSCLSPCEGQSSDTSPLFSPSPADPLSLCFRPRTHLLLGRE